MGLSSGAQSTLSRWIRRPSGPVTPPQALGPGSPLVTIQDTQVPSPLLHGACSSSTSPPCGPVVSGPGLDRGRPQVIADVKPSVTHRGQTPAPEASSPADHPPKRRRMTGIASGDTPQAPPQAPAGSGHQLHTWGKAEWCSICGRVSAALAAGRAQQWRRPCNPLPSYVSKQQKGHRLIYAGQWHCQECPCPPDKLYRVKCGQAPSRGSTPALGPAPGDPMLMAPALGSGPPRRPPLQASLTRFFVPAAKRARTGACAPALLPQATSRPPG